MDTIRSTLDGIIRRFRAINIRQNTTEFTKQIPQNFNNNNDEILRRSYAIDELRNATEFTKQIPQNFNNDNNDEIPRRSYAIDKLQNATEFTKQIPHNFNNNNDEIPRRSYAIDKFQNATEFSKKIPHNFSIYPSIEELTGIIETEQNKENKIKGPFVSPIDYIDLHFKLLKADFFLPLSRDIENFLCDKNYESIIVHKHIQFEHRDIYKNYNAYKIKLKGKNLQNDMQGSLIIVSKDNFQTALYGKFAENNIIYFENNADILLNRNYTLIECNNFFEPYYNSLMFLKELNPQYFPMKKYIINVKQNKTLPNYCPPNLEYTLNMKQHCFNKSQFNAYKGALLNEFALIQGPPGTGKTFVGVEIVRTLLEISNHWRNKGPILVVCYTNHALDQFLVKLTSVTNEIIRVGGRCENQSLERYKICNLRKEIKCPTKLKHPTTSRELFALKDRIEKLRLKISLCDTDLFYNPDYFKDMNLSQVLLWLLSEPDSSDRLQFKEILTTYKSDQYEGLLEEMQYIEKAILKNKSKLMKTKNMRQVTHIDAQLTIVQIKISDLKNIYINRERKENSLDCPYNEPVRLMTSTQKWQYLSRITNLVKLKLIKELTKYVQAYKKIFLTYEMQRNEKDIILMQSKLIIGMTTTVASRMNSILEKVGCPIVIVEEAAEVLEAHLLSSLTKNCDHLILIGDHQQLRPKTADMVIGETYKLSTSLFERMVINGVPFYTLETQYRMRPEISALITPSIYPKLFDAPKVTNYEAIRGLCQPVCFINHKRPEQHSENSSKNNPHEAKFLIKVVNHLILNGYKNDEITVIAAYGSQVDRLQKELKEYPESHHVKITTIDGYQGEENRIIILSLVRNNSRRSIGFLKNSNRVCVALSRAQEGLIIMGNMNLLSKQSQLWRNIQAELVKKNSLNNCLKLKCENHSNVIEVKEISDFNKAPMGGCSLQCRNYYKCGHLCKLKCHPLEIHKQKCRQCKKKSLDDQRKSIKKNY